MIEFGRVRRLSPRQPDRGLSTLDELNLILVRLNKTEQPRPSLMELVELPAAGREDFIPAGVLGKDGSVDSLGGQRAEVKRRNRSLCDGGGRGTPDTPERIDDDRDEPAGGVYEELVVTAIVHLAVESHHGQHQPFLTGKAPLVRRADLRLRLNAPLER